MNMNNLLNEEIQDEFKNLKTMELGSEQYEKTVNGLTKLMDRKIELEKLDAEREDRIVFHEDEMCLKTQQANDDKKDRWIRNILTGVGIAASTGLAVWGTKTTLKFEETGSVTTILGRGFINKLLPKK